MPTSAVFARLPEPGTYTGASITALPFVSRCSKWSVPPADTYLQAAERGAEYAAHLAAFLRDNPDMRGANTLFLVVKDMDLNTPGLTKGYAAGFLGEIERRLC